MARAGVLAGGPGGFAGVRIPRLGLRFNVRKERIGGGGPGADPGGEPEGWWRRVVRAIRTLRFGARRH